MPSVINSDNGVISGTSGLKTSGSNDGLLDFQSNGTRIAGITTSAFQVGTNNISAVNSMGFRNRIINGDMRIDQRNAGASVTQTTAVLYPVDRFAINGSITSKFTAQRSTTAPPGFSNSLLITSSAATTPGSTDYYLFRHAIEGFNTADFAFGSANAQSITLSFWVRSSVTGTFGGNLMNASTNRNYVFSYSIASANTWEYKTITIAGDTSGTWATDNTVGLYIDFSVGAGSSVLGSAGSWGTSVLRGVTGQTNLVATNGATFYITGVQVEAGSVATPFERRDYGRELIMCQRYFTNWVGDSSGTGFRAIGSGYVPSTTTDLTALIPLSVSMRTTPTLSYSGTITILAGNVSGTVSSIQTTYASSNQSVWAGFRTGATFTTGNAGILYTQNASTNFVSASAEL